MIDYELVPLNEVLLNIRDIFFRGRKTEELSVRKSLTANYLISSLTKNSRLKYFDRINNFEDGGDEILPQILQILNHYNDDSEVIIVIDSCFKEGFGFNILNNSFKCFCNYHWDNFEHSDLLEPFDHIFLFPKERELIVLNHEGALYIFSS